VTRPWVRRGIYGLRTAGSQGRVGGSQEQDISSGVDRTINRNGGGSHSGSEGSVSHSRGGSAGGGSHTALSGPAGINTHSAMVPSFRLAEQTAKTRALKAENEALKARVAELETALKSKRDEFVFRRGKRAS
jgi:hypothetical protein